MWSTKKRPNWRGGNPCHKLKMYHAIFKKLNTVKICCKSERKSLKYFAEIVHAIKGSICWHSIAGMSKPIIRYARTVVVVFSKYKASSTGTFKSSIHQKKYWDILEAYLYLTRTTLSKCKKTPQNAQNTTNSSTEKISCSKTRPHNTRLTNTHTTDQPSKPPPQSDDSQTVFESMPQLVAIWASFSL